MKYHFDLTITYFEKNVPYLTLLSRLVISIIDVFKEISYITERNVNSQETQHKTNRKNASGAVS